MCTGLLICFSFPNFVEPVHYVLKLPDLIILGTSDICHYMGMIIMINNFTEINLTNNWIFRFLPSIVLCDTVGCLSRPCSFKHWVKLSIQTHFFWQTIRYQFTIFFWKFVLSLAFDIFRSCVRFELSSTCLFLFGLEHCRRTRLLLGPGTPYLGRAPKTRLPALQLVGRHLHTFRFPLRSARRRLCLDKSGKFLHVRFWNTLCCIGN